MYDLWPAYVAGYSDPEFLIPAAVALRRVARSKSLVRLEDVAWASGTGVWQPEPWRPVFASAVRRGTLVPVAEGVFRSTACAAEVPGPVSPPEVPGWWHPREPQSHSSEWLSKLVMEDKPRRGR